MSPRQIRITVGITAAVVLCWLSAPYWGSNGGDDLPVSVAPLSFDGEQAYQTAREFVTKNPKRVLGSLEARQATGFIQDKLIRLGYQVSFRHFDALIAGRRQVGRNILAFRAGAVPETLAAVAHYDTARTTVEGAMDDGAGVGVLLELARVFAASSLRRSVLLIATDGEEWGMLGAADIAAYYPERSRIAAVLSLDGVTIGELAAFRLDSDGQRSGYSPAWLRRIASGAAAAQGLPVLAASGFQEDLQRAIELSRTDQGPFLTAGIPAINLGSESVDEARVREVYHSAADTITNLKASSVGQYGAAAERILRSIDELPAIPAAAGNAFRWRNDTFVAGRAMTVLHCLAFLPFLVVLYFGWLRYRSSLTAEATLREAAFFLSWLAPLGLMYSMILFCRLMRLLPQNSFYPGPLKDPMLENPAWGVVLAIVGGAAVVGTGLHFLTRYLTRGQPRSFGASRTVLSFFLLAVVLIALLFSPYWATTFLALPALVWATVERGRSPGRRVAGALAILAAGLGFYAAVFFSERSLGTDAGWDLLWYAVLGLSNGMLQWKGYFLAASAVVLGLRFLSLQVSRLNASSLPSAPGRGREPHQPA